MQIAPHIDRQMTELDTGPFTVPFSCYSSKSFACYSANTGSLMKYPGLDVAISSMSFADAVMMALLCLDRNRQLVDKHHG